MTTPPSGWYPDPSGDPSKFRYWDGATWTDHFAPQQAAAPAQATPPTGGGEPVGGSPDGTDDAAAAGEPGTAAPGAGEEQPTQQFPAGYAQQQAQDPYAQPGQYPPGYGQQQGYGQPGQEQPYGAAYAAGAPGMAPGEQPKKGKGLIIGIIIAAAVLVIAAIIAVILLVTGNGDDDRGGPDTPPPATTQPTDEPTDEPTEDPGGTVEDGGEIALDEPITGSFGADGSWIGTLTIDEDTSVLLDTQATDDMADLEMSITGEDVDLENDDRDYFESDAEWLDPAIAVHLEPGTYEVEVNEWYGDSGEFELNAFDVPMFDVDATETVDERSGGAEAYGAVEVTEDGTYVFDTVSTEGDAEMTIVFPDGTYEYSDDSDDGAGEFQDPYLSLDLEPGIYFVFVGEWFDEPLDLELSITQE